MAEVLTEPHVVALIEEPVADNYEETTFWAIKRTLIRDGGYVVDMYLNIPGRLGYFYITGPDSPRMSTILNWSGCVIRGQRPEWHYFNGSAFRIEAEANQALQDYIYSTTLYTLANIG